MGKVSAHFSEAEIACRCDCGQDTVNKQLYVILERFRKLLGDVPMTTHCVNRCTAHNLKVGGVPKTEKSNGSRHLYGMAWDGICRTYSNRQLHKLAKKAYKLNIISGGLGLYRWGIHIDSSKKRMWKG